MHKAERAQLKVSKGPTRNWPITNHTHQWIEKKNKQTHAGCWVFFVEEHVCLHVEDTEIGCLNSGNQQMRHGGPTKIPTRIVHVRFKVLSTDQKGWEQQRHCSVTDKVYHSACRKRSVFAKFVSLAILLFLLNQCFVPAIVWFLECTFVGWYFWTSALPFLLAEVLCFCIPAPKIRPEHRFYELHLPWWKWLGAWSTKPTLHTCRSCIIRSNKCDRLTASLTKNHDGQRSGSYVMLHGDFNAGREIDISLLQSLWRDFKSETTGRAQRFCLKWIWNDRLYWNWVLIVGSVWQLVDYKTDFSIREGTCVQEGYHGEWVSYCWLFSHQVGMKYNHTLPFCVYFSRLCLSCVLWHFGDQQEKGAGKWMPPRKRRCDHVNVQRDHWSSSRFFWTLPVLLLNEQRMDWISFQTLYDTKLPWIYKPKAAWKTLYDLNSWNLHVACPQRKGTNIFLSLNCFVLTWLLSKGKYHLGWQTGSEVNEDMFESKLAVGGFVGSSVLGDGFLVTCKPDIQRNCKHTCMHVNHNHCSLCMCMVTSSRCRREDKQKRNGWKVSLETQLE